MNNDQPNTLNLFFHNKEKERNEMDTIEKATAKKELDHLIDNNDLADDEIDECIKQIEGEVTASTVLEQCISMSKNSELDAFFSYSGHIDKHHVYVNYKATYNPNDADNNTIYNSIHGNKSLADIYQDLIKIEIEQGNEKK